MTDLTTHQRQMNTTFRIHSLGTFSTQVAKEKDKQAATIARVFAEHDIPGLIADLQELNQLRANFTKLGQLREEGEEIERKLRSVQRVHEG